MRRAPLWPQPQRPPPSNQGGQADRHGRLYGAGARRPAEEAGEYLAAGRFEDFNLEAREGLETYQAILNGGDDLGLSLPETEAMRVATLAILTGEGAAALAAPPAARPTVWSCLMRGNHAYQQTLIRVG